MRCTGLAKQFDTVVQTYNLLVVAIPRDDVLPIVLGQIETIRPKIELVRYLYALDATTY